MKNKTHITKYKKRFGLHYCQMCGRLSFISYDIGGSWCCSKFDCHMDAISCISTGSDFTTFDKSDKKITKYDRKNII